MIRRIYMDVAAAWGETRRSLLSARGFLILAGLTFCNYAVLHTITDWAAKYEEPVNPVGMPFLFYDLYFLFIFGLMIVFLFSEVPFINSRTNMMILRLGRRRWVGICLLHIFMLSLIYMATEYLVSALCCKPVTVSLTNWGRVWKTLSLGVLEDEIYVPRNVLILFTPGEALGRVMILGVLVVFFMGCLMLLISLLGSNQLAVFVMSFFSVMPLFIVNAWSFYPHIYFCSPVSWIGIIEHAHYYYFGGPTSYQMIWILAVTDILVVCVTLFTALRVDLNEWRGEDE